MKRKPGRIIAASLMLAILMAACSQPSSATTHGVPDRHPRDRGRLTSRPDQQPGSGT